ncbi:MAG: hypothetical protein AAFW75_17870, partial [Cyanobacteria bacterium J06636_16]
GTLIWQRCFKGKQGVDKRLEAAARGSQPDIEVLQTYLDKELDEGGPFAKEVKQIAGEIHQVVFEMKDVNAENVQQNFGGQNLQVNDPQAPVVQAENSPITINYN